VHPTLCKCLCIRKKKKHKRSPVRNDKKGGKKRRVGQKKKWRWGGARERKYAESPQPPEDHKKVRYDQNS